jgi:hypothetical protein
MKNAMIATMTTATITPTIIPEDVPPPPLSSVGIDVGVEVVLAFTKST